MDPIRISSASPFAPSIGFSLAVAADRLVFVSGQSAVAKDGTVVGGNDPYLQAAEAMRKVLDAVERAGGSRTSVVQSRMYLPVREHWQAVGRAHAEAFGDAPPAATMVVCGLIDERMLVEVEAVAYVAEQ